jgi:hypothetical protein
VGESTWQIFDQPATHPCCPEYVTSYHCKIRTVPEECLKEIQKLSTSGAFSSDHIQQHLFRSKGWNVATDLIYQIGYRVRCNGNNDTLHLKHTHTHSHTNTHKLVYTTAYDDLERLMQQVQLAFVLLRQQ